MLSYAYNVSLVYSDKVNIYIVTFNLFVPYQIVMLRD